MGSRRCWMHRRRLRQIRLFLRALPLELRPFALAALRGKL